MYSKVRSFAEGDGRECLWWRHASLLGDLSLSCFSMKIYFQSKYGIENIYQKRNTTGVRGEHIFIY